MGDLITDSNPQIALEQITGQERRASRVYGSNDLSLPISDNPNMTRQISDSMAHFCHTSPQISVTLANSQQQSNNP